MSQSKSRYTREHVVVVVGKTHAYKVAFVLEFQKINGSEKLIEIKRFREQVFPLENGEDWDFLGKELKKTQLQAAGSCSAQ